MQIKFLLKKKPFYIVFAYNRKTYFMNRLLKQVYNIDVIFSMPLYSAYITDIALGQQFIYL